MESEKITATLNNLVQKTTEKKIDWKLINPNAVRWTRILQGKAIWVTVQKQPKPVSQASPTPFYYSLNIQSPPEIILQLNNLNDSTYSAILEKLYNVATTVANESSTNILDNLLDGI